MLFSNNHKPNRPVVTVASRKRRSFTLVELLMVIMLIGIMSSMVLVALAGATQSAKEDRTKTQILKIHSLLMEKWEQYQYRRVPATLAMSQRRRMGVSSTFANTNNRAMALERLAALRELMRMEMPSFQSDVTTPALKLRDPLQLTTPYQPALWRAYRQRVPDLDAWTVQYQSSECLYLILSQLRDADSSALEFFKENEIGDLDGDGVNEIHDAWGNPIRWMLWAPGYVSPLQEPLWQDLNGNGSVELAELDKEQNDVFDLANYGSAYVDSNSDNLPDAFQGDFAQLPRALYPLVYSAGADGKIGITLGSNVNNVADQSWANTDVLNDPYNRNTNYKMYLLGATSVDRPEALADDISNHYLTTR